MLNRWIGEGKEREKKKLGSRRSGQVNCSSPERIEMSSRVMPG